MCNSVNETVFMFLKEMLLDTRNLSVQYIENWNNSLENIDMGMRAELCSSQELYASLRQTITELKSETLYYLKDTLHVGYVFFRGEKEQDIYSIGPFRTMYYDEQEFAQLQIQNQLGKNALEELRSLLLKIPINITRNEALGIARHCMRQFYNISDPTVEDVSLENTQLDVEKYIPQNDLNARIKRIEEIYVHESKLFGFVSEGNYVKAMREAEFFMKSNPTRKSFSDMKASHRSYLYSANTSFRKAAQSVGIHPYHLDEISQRFAHKLTMCLTHQQLDSIYLEMIEEYCRLCREYPNQKYSYNVQRITNYISFNLSDDLTPDSIAKALNFSPNYISKKVKDEVGMPLMAYIMEQRILLSKRLLKDSPMSVKDISLYIGISDWNYFTKLFKKSVGCTPSAYRKSLDKKT